MCGRWARLAFLMARDRKKKSKRNIDETRGGCLPDPTSMSHSRTARRPDDEKTIVDCAYGKFVGSQLSAVVRIVGDKAELERISKAKTNELDTSYEHRVKYGRQAVLVWDPT